MGSGAGGKEHSSGGAMLVLERVGPVQMAPH